MTASAGTRVRLREITQDDVVPSYLEWMNNPEVLRHLSSHGPWSEEALRSYVTEMRGRADVLFMAIIEQESGRHIGNAKLGPRRDDGTASLGIVIGARDCWGKGYATEAIRLLAALGFREWSLDAVTAGATHENVASIRAFLHAGFHIVDDADFLRLRLEAPEEPDTTS